MVLNQYFLMELHARLGFIDWAKKYCETAVDFELLETSMKE